MKSSWGKSSFIGKTSSPVPTRSAGGGEPGTTPVRSPRMPDARLTVDQDGPVDDEAAKVGGRTFVLSFFVGFCRPR